MMDSMELMLAVFPASAPAEAALAELHAQARRKLLPLLNAALLVKDAQGRTRRVERGDVTATGGALAGAASGALVGLLAGPGGALLGALIGALTGGAAAARLDLGFANPFLDEIKVALRPGTAAVLLLVDEAGCAAAAAALQAHGATLIRQVVQADLVAKLAEQQNQPPAPPDPSAPHP
jgi:uncharacterized membrane protein